MTWDEEIESWGFTWVNDFAERAIDGKLSIMAFVGDEFEIGYMNEQKQLKEIMCSGMTDLKKQIDKLRCNQKNYSKKSKNNL